MKILFILLLVSIYSISFSQSISETDIKELAKLINDELQGIDLCNGATFRGCLAYGRTLVYQYDVDKNWYPPENMKEDLIANFKEAGNADTFFINDIDLELYYYSGNKLLKRVSIKSNEFSDLNFQLGDYLSINGHPKSKGVNLKLKPPIDWEIKEGDRPNIVKKFCYKNNSYMILVKENITFISRNETRELLKDDDYINEIISGLISSLQNPEILNQGIVTVDKYPALVFTLKGQIERSGIKMSLISKYWTIFYEDKIVFLESGGFNDKEFYSLERLYNLITNSVIFPEQYNW